MIPLCRGKRVLPGDTMGHLCIALTDAAGCAVGDTLTALCCVQQYTALYYHSQVWVSCVSSEALAALAMKIAIVRDMTPVAW